MYPILFSLGKIHVYTHGLFMALGAIFGGIVIFFLAKKQRLKTDFILDLCVYALLAGIIGARILYVILYYNEFSSFKEVFFIWNGGLVSYGGIIGGLIVAGIFFKVKKEPVLEWFDIGIIGLMVGWAFGRIGCLLNGDSFGIMNFNKIAIWSRIPTQLFESVWALIIALGLGFYFLKLKDKFKLPDGVIFFSGIALYSVGRFIIDFWRDEEVMVWFMKTGQFGSLLVLIFVVLAISYLFRRDRGLN